VSSLGSEDIARIKQESSWDYHSAQPRVSPGSLEEARALARIDELRDDDLHRQTETFEKRMGRLSRNKYGGRPFGRAD
jgi:hypothetical protein